MCDDGSGDAAGSGSSQLVEGEEGDSWDQLVVAEAREEGDVGLEEGEPGWHSDAGEQPGQLDEFSRSPATIPPAPVPSIPRGERAQHRDDLFPA
ncbi:MAG: hypothetical protein M3024_16815 [Candidatus Dormibacteraeota bacterium]|nr:hypothetical protein [Candidatus Dormibacteraeota bacterium]